ncbi:MAG: chaperone modulator CbpM [Stellaceae bacterium]
MSELDRVCGLVGLEVEELERWIGESWVLPAREGGAYVFHEVDVARVRLIAGLTHELQIDEDAMPVVLGLLDQLYALRRRLKGMAAALAALPPELRQEIARRLEKE